MDNKKPAAKLEFSYQLRHARLDRASMVIRICHHNRLRRVIPLGVDRFNQFSDPRSGRG